MTRKQVADGVSKDVLYARDAPFYGGNGHVPMLAQIRKQWYNPHQRRQVWGVTPQQRKQGHLAWKLNTPEWTDFVAQTACQLTQPQIVVQNSDEDIIPALHKIAIECFQTFFPPFPLPNVNQTQSLNT